MLRYTFSIPTPNVDNAPITATQMTAIITAYSVTVGPSWDRRNLEMFLIIVFIAPLLA